jgi:prefoldin subunit 5
MAIEEDVTALQSAVAALQTTLNSLNTTVGNHTTSISSLNTTVSSHTTSIGNINTTVAGHTTSISSLNTSVSSLSTTSSEHTTSISSLNNSIALKADINNPAFTGNPTAPTKSRDDNSTSLATTEYVDRAIDDNAIPYSDANPLMDSESASQGVSLKLSRQDHAHPTDASRAPIESPAFTGMPTSKYSPGLDSEDANNDTLATTFFVSQIVANAINIIGSGGGASGSSSYPVGDPSSKIYGGNNVNDIIENGNEGGEGGDGGEGGEYGYSSYKTYGGDGGEGGAGGANGSIEIWTLPDE